MKGEVAVITIPPEYAFGSTQSKQYIAIVPPNSTVVYEVELASFVKESWDVNNEDKIEAAGLKKQEGNALFKLDKYARASKRYEKLQLKQCAACKLKLKDYKEAMNLCTK
ncbi:Peptidyl-prolyl cis-trans isomerase, partial [Zea mays]